MVAVLRTITGEPDLEERIREGLNAARAIFMVCVHLLVPLTLMRNPEDFAEKVRRTPANQSFKEDRAGQHHKETEAGAWRVHLGRC